MERSSVAPRSLGPALYWTAEQIRQFVSRNDGHDSISATYFDPASIMQDFFPREWTLNGVGITANTALSSADKQLIAKMYPQR